MAKQPEKRTTKVVAEGATSGKDAPRQPAPEPEPAPEAEPQASPEPEPTTDKLLAAANAASGPARNAWLAFLLLLAYLLVTLAGVTHKDLLLNSPIELPIVNVKIPLFSFFLAAPFLLLLVHLGLLVQHAMVAHKYQHFSKAIAVSEEGQAGDHPDRQLVNNYVFSQMLAGPKPPWPLQMLMRLMVFVTLSLLPVLVLLYFQIKFLPSHDVAITHAHRIAILLDLALLFIVRPFIAMPYLRPHKKSLSLGNQSWRWQISYASIGIAVPLCLVVVSFSLLVATVPQACFSPSGKQPEDWPSGEQPEEQEEECFSLDRTTAKWWAMEVKSGQQTRKVFAPTKWLFEGEPNQTSGTPESLFSRNLIVTDKDLVAKKDFEKEETSLQLRGRDLRFAVLDRSDLHSADLYDSDLRGASAKLTRLQKADLEEADLRGAGLFDAKLQGAILIKAQLQGADLQKADLEEADLRGADLTDAKLRGANLIKAQLQGADLTDAELQGANLTDADLEEADLRGADLTDAELKRVNLRGAKLRPVDLRKARLTEADHPGVVRSRAGLPVVEPTSTRMSGIDRDIDRHGLDFKGFDLDKYDPQLCRDACRDDTQCKAWAYQIRKNKPRCWLKYAVPPPFRRTGFSSGIKIQ